MNKTIRFTKAEAEKFRADKFDPFFRSDATKDHWRKTHDIEHMKAYTRRQLFWLLDRDLLNGYKLEII
jgi:hypothetical protein